MPTPAAWPRLPGWVLADGPGGRGALGRRREGGGAGRGARHSLTLEGRLDLALAGARESSGEERPYALAGIGVGAFLPRLHAEASWPGSWEAGLVDGAPGGGHRRAHYAGTAVVLPIVQALLAKGAALGTVWPFLDGGDPPFPAEAILLRRVVKTPGLVFLGVVAAGIWGWGTSSARSCERRRTGQEAAQRLSQRGAMTPRPGGDPPVGTDQEQGRGSPASAR